MKQLTFDEGDKSYAQRYKNSLLLNLFISALLGFVVLIKSNETLPGLLVTIVFFTFTYYKLQRSDRLFIKEITIDGDELRIAYLDKGKAHTLKGFKHQFRIKKEMVYLSRSRTIYLAVYKENKKFLEQFERSEWTEKKMDEVAEWFAD